MTNKEAKKIIYNQWQAFLDDNIDYAGISEAYKMAMKALEQQPSEEDIHREREQAYMLGYEDASKKFRTEPCEDCRNCKKWNKCPCGKKGHENGTSIGYSIGECKDYEPCEDCISRQAVLDAINFEDKWLFDANGHNANTHIAFSGLKSRVKAEPSVTPRIDLAETSQDCISREAVQDLISRWLSDYLLDETREALETINYKIGDMPPVFPQRKVGKWTRVPIRNEKGGCIGAKMICSECDNDNKHDEYMKFCPNCGSYNAENKENEE